VSDRTKRQKFRPRKELGTRVRLPRGIEDVNTGEQQPKEEAQVWKGAPIVAFDGMQRLPQEGYEDGSVEAGTDDDGDIAGPMNGRQAPERRDCHQGVTDTVR